MKRMEKRVELILNYGLKGWIKEKNEKDGEKG